MPTIKVLRGAVAVAILCLLTSTARSQNLAFGDWLKVAGQAKLEYRWTAQPGGDGLPAACVLQVRSVDPADQTQYVGSLEFQDRSGQAVSRSLEVNMTPGRVIDRRQGGGCVSVSGVHLSARETPR